MHIEVPNVKFEHFSNTDEEPSFKIKERVENARKIQQKRYAEHRIYTNSELTPKLIEKFCKLELSSTQILEKYFEKNKLSARSYAKILKIARTIADLDGSKNIRDEHILEAIRYRFMDKR